MEAVPRTLAQDQRRWFGTYFVTWLVGLLIANLNLDGGILLVSYLMVSIPSMVVSFLLSKSARIVRMYILAGLLGVLTLGLSGIVVPYLHDDFDGMLFSHLRDHLARTRSSQMP
jgi:hypothetical protein